MKKYISLFISIFILAACGSGPDTGLIIAGSTSVQPYIEVLAEEFAHHYPDYYIDVQGGGSSAGLAAVASHTADIGMSSRDLTEKEHGLWRITFAMDGLAIVVHPSNPVYDMTLEQLRGVYAGRITNWGELGGNNNGIHVITREEGSGTRSAFESLAMGGEYITPKAIVQDSNGAVRQLVLNDKNAVGFMSLGLVDETVKALSLDGEQPGWNNLLAGTYMLSRPFILACESEPDGVARIFIDFIATPEAQAVLVSEGLIPQ